MGNREAKKEKIIYSKAKFNMKQMAFLDARRQKEK